MKVLTFVPGKDPELREIDGSLKSMQALVDGHIETVDLPGELVLICNELGRIENLDPGAKMYVDGALWDVIRGTCFVCRADGDEFVGLEEGDEERILEYVRPIYSHNEKAPAGRPPERSADLKDQDQDSIQEEKSQMDKRKMEFFERIGAFAEAVYDACEGKEHGTVCEFTCPLCGGKAAAEQSSDDGHHRALCTKCGASIIE